MKNTKEYHYQRAMKKLEKIKSFYSNLLTYCLVISFLAYLNYLTTDTPWVLFPAVGWGIGLVGHWMEAFGYNPLFGRNWEERKIHELMNNEEF